MLNDVLNKLADVCVNKKIQIVTAESCTGGLVAKLITDRQGSSQWFERGFVTYSNLAKEQMLGVNSALLKQYGAVSEQVAASMAEGALKHSQTHYALSITGIAGPGGGTDSKPVGTVCFGWAYLDQENGSVESITVTEWFSGDREAIRNQSAAFALQELCQLIALG